MSTTQPLTSSNSFAVAQEHMRNTVASMRNFRNFTLSLDLEAAERVERLVKHVGGSVGSFSKVWITDLSRLTPDQLRKLTELTQAWSETNAAEAQLRSVKPS